MPLSMRKQKEIVDLLKIIIFILAFISGVLLAKSIG